MSLYAWCARRSGGLALLALVAFCYYVVQKEATSTRHGQKYPPHDDASDQDPVVYHREWSTSIFAYYCLLIHFLVFIFPMRACWALVDITSRYKTSLRSKTLREFKFSHTRRLSSTSLSSSETLTSSRDGSSSASSEAGDIESDSTQVDSEAERDRVVHGIIIPNYKEEMDTLRETLEVLASHPQARNTYDIYLAMEQREANGELKAMTLVSEFAKKFRNIDFSVHPSDIPGEAAGKGSNVAWAARKASEKYPMAMRKDVIFTGIDADSHLAANYFALLTTMHMAYPETATTTLYSAPIIFDRNAHNVPAIVRVADILWCAASISGMYKGSSVAPPTSVYSLPLELIDRVGGWDCDSEAIGEDLHMYLKCFFALNGNLTCRTIMSPVSQSNVHAGGEKKGYRGVYMDMNARYKQALRHMWGALDTGFALRKVVELWQERKYTSRAFRPLHSSLNDASDSYVPESQREDGTTDLVLESGIFSDVTHDTLKSPDYVTLYFVMHRLFEAHFLPVHTTILIVASTLYVWVTEGSSDPQTQSLAWIFTVCNILRTAGFILVGLYLFLYETFHRIAVATREEEMAKAGLAEGMRFSHRSVGKNFIDYFMVPLVAPIFGSIPCAQAQICHFWTLDLVYTVSKKVTRQQRQRAASIKTMV